MRQLKPYIDKLNATLNEHGIYHPRNDMLIHSVAKAMRDRDRLSDDLGNRSTILTQTGSQRQTKVSIHPSVEAIARQDNIIIRGLYYLGIGNTKSDIAPMEQQQFTDFLNSI